MELHDAIYRRRSIRRFSPKPVEKDALYAMVQAARLAPQASNLQPMKYMIVHQKRLLEPVFSCLKWAGYLPDYAPKPGYRPTAYIVVLTDTGIKVSHTDTDAGAAVENMLLTALDYGLGTCWIGSVDREKLRKLLTVPQNLEIHSVVAVGYPAQEPVWEEKDSDSIRYYLDEDGRLHVPKRRMGEILVTIYPDLSDFPEAAPKKIASAKTKKEKNEK